MRKIRVLKEIELDARIFLTSFDKAAKLLTKKKVELEKQGWTSIHLKLVEYYGTTDLSVYGMRLENDTEFNKRKKDLGKAEKAKEARKNRILEKYNEIKAQLKKENL